MTQIFEPTQTTGATTRPLYSARGTDVLQHVDYQVLPYRALSRPYQLAIAYYMAIDGEAWTGVLPFNEAVSWKTPAERRKGLEDHLHVFVELFGDERFGVVNLPSDVVRAGILASPYIRSDYPDWQSYENSYKGLNSLPNHGTEDRWPVVLSDFEDEFLQDGWHRVHCYLQRGDETIPAVFYPRAHHSQR